MINKKYLFYIVTMVVCLIVLNEYKDQSIEKYYVKNTTIEVQNTQSKHSMKENNCLKNALYYEARSEGKLGILAVASVIENRKNSSRYPSTYCNVINQRKQFSYTLENKPDVESILHKLTAYDKISYRYISELSDKMTNGMFETILPKGVMWYTTKRISNAWTKSKNIYATIGVHHFYKQKEKTNASKY